MHLIDAHQHLLYPQQIRYSWTQQFAPLAREFSLQDYQKATRSIKTHKTIFVEVDADEADIDKENQYIYQLAQQTQSPVAGIIAACRPERSDFPQQLARLQHDKLVGLRRVLHVVPDDLSQSTLFRQNIRSLAPLGLSFDLCLRGDQLPIGMELVSACPQVQFILDHCGNPSITSAQPETQWRQHIEQLAQYPNLSCKISGLVTQIQNAPIHLATLQAYLNHIYQQFGPDRILYGGDWPVCQLNSDITTWAQIFQEWLATLDPSSQVKIAQKNAEKIYALPHEPTETSPAD